ncbi:MAG TPA: FecR family protein [Allosphingosinicella sp.]
MSRRIVAALTAASLAASPLLAQGNAVGINAAVRNKVVIVGAATRKARPAVVRERVILNDEVRTAAASQLQILLLDRTTFTVGANARVAVDRFVYDPASNSRSTGVRVTRGAFRFMSGRALRRPSGPVSVRTPVATIGVRGTIFEGVVGEDAIRIASREAAVGKVKAKKDEASLIVLRGPGPRTQGDTRPGAVDVTVGDRTVTLDRPGLALYAPRVGAPPIGPFPISAAGLMALQSLLRTTAEPGGGGGKTSNGTRDALLGAAGAAAIIGGAAILGGKKKRREPGEPQPQQKSPNDIE